MTTIHEPRDRGTRRGPHGRGRRRGGRGDRAQRGDVRAATLLLLGEGPMHGYQLMQEIAARTEGAWRPSPGAVYPTLSMLEDEGLVAISRDGARQMVALTEAGRTFLDEHRDSFGDPFAERSAASGARELVDDVRAVAGAVTQVARTGSEAQVKAARAKLTETKRALYLILADEA